MINSIIISNCPYCGGLNCNLERIENDPIKGRAYFYVKCGMCGAQGPVFDRERAIAEWNGLSKRVLHSFTTNEYREFLSREWLEWIGKGTENDRR